MDKTFGKELLKKAKTLTKNKKKLPQEVGKLMLMHKKHSSFKGMIDFSEKRMASDKEYYAELYNQLMIFLEK